MSRLVSRRALGLIAIVLVTAAIAFPLGVLASHQFSDVPDSSIYHADIDAVADAGVTTGCGDGTTYCPSAFVTREQMAAFMNRLGALAANKTPVVNATKLDGLDSSQFARADEVAIGHDGCIGRAMTPSISSNPWSTNGVIIYPTTAADVAFTCDLQLPDGATVTQVDFEVNDQSATELVTCTMYRSRAFPDVEALLQDAMATGATTAIAAPTIAVLTDSTIAFAVVDNTIYHYYALCTPQATGAATAVAGVRVTYEVSGLAIP